MALPAPAAARATVSTAYGVVGKRLLVADGRAAGVPRSARAQLWVRSGGRSRLRATGRVRRGRFNLRWKVPRSVKKSAVRVVIVKSRSRKTVVAGRWKRLDLGRLRKGAKIARVSSAAIKSAPAPGTPGNVIVNGASGGSPGEVIASGPAPGAPDGLLAEIVGKSTAGGQTTFQTVPASLPDVVPVGAFDIDAGGVASGSARNLARSSASLGDLITKHVSCSAGATLEASAKASLSAKVGLEASWGLFSGAKANFTGSVTAGVSVGASISGGAQCRLDPVKLSPAGVQLGSLTFSIGPVPVYVAIRANAAISAEASASAAMTTGASASATASAGVSYDGRFSARGGLTHRFSATPPTLSAEGSAKVTITPSVDLLLYGVAGPHIDFNAGLKLAASSSMDPWWKLTAPMDLGASLSLEVWKLKLSSGRRVVWSAEPTLAQADPSTSPASPPGTPDNPLERARLTWDTDADIDMHIWDDEGDHAYFSDLSAIPDAELLKDIIPGFGPEIFQEFGDPGRHYTFGLCNYNDSAELTTATLEVVDPNGTTRTFDRELPYEKAAVLVTDSPAGSPYIPPQGWCDTYGDGDPTGLG